MAYVFDNAATETEDRFRVLEAVYDAVSIERLREFGVGRGWRCLEVGGGGGSMARWLAQQVGPTGQVVATDIDPSRMRHTDDGVEVLRHDITTDELPSATYDLVHARLVLLHLPGRLHALDRIRHTLKPGGVLVLDEFDCSYLPLLAAPGPGDAALYARVTDGIHQLIYARGGDPDWGRHALSAMRRAGFVDLAQRSHSESWTGGSLGAKLHRANTVQVRRELVARGLATAEEIRRFLTLLEDPDLVMNSYLMHTIRGRRP
ncbi:class I SAM-dependent methyltransferase [Nocardia mexicana]|uniref:Methyltransferase family protein n=1 Tax=Nocardia mexicana TaxID=279262 RepID=A0A370HE93_9NOCA|nr:class I SAM-dependent methyltransferase [Nocardia mexicana]RDI55543.1 methyltransferase family protein [Nocardia mexicana]